MDLQIANWIYNIFGQSKVALTIAKIVTYLGNKWVIIAIVALLLLFKKTRKLGIYALITVGVTYLFNDFILKNIVKRERPFVANPEFLNMLELAGYEVPDGYSMASGHSAVAMCLAVSIFLFHKKSGSGAIILAFLVGVSRMMLCVHYFTDVLAGFGLGIIFAIMIHYVLNYLIKLHQSKRRTKNEDYSVGNGQSA